MGPRRTVLAVAGLILLGPVLEAADEAPADEAMTAIGQGRAVAAAARSSVDVVPWIGVEMPEPTRAKLLVAFSLAVERVREVTPCRELFAELGADPVEMLATTLYFPADPYKETTRCRSALAYSYVGAAPTRLCRRFAFLPDEEAAVVLVHEALHHAGLDERPSDPRAMSSGAITVIVRRACGLQR